MCYGGSEKERTLQRLEDKIGVHLKKFNDQIPTYWTTQEIHRRMRKTYNQRHSVFADMFFPGEEGQGILFDPASYPWKERRNVIVK